MLAASKMLEGTSIETNNSKVFPQYRAQQKTDWCTGILKLLTTSAESEHLQHLAIILLKLTVLDIKLGFKHLSHAGISAREFRKIFNRVNKKEIALTLHLCQLR